MKTILRLAVGLLAAVATIPADGQQGDNRLPKEQHRWTNGLPADASYFPIGVWLQNPSQAARYKAAGFNLYVGLWHGPTEAQLTTLQRAGMQVICEQNEFALSNRTNPTIVGWMHGDEPDNAQELGQGKGYGPPVLPEKIVRDYMRIREADPTRPVMLNLGQGVAWDNYIGRGVRRNHPEDYPQYAQGCDIVSFDIYPVVHDSPAMAGKLEYVAAGVERLVKWTRGEKTVWNCIECTHIGNPDLKASPEQVRSEVWMALIHGSRGLIYFVHQFKPVFREAALLDDPKMLEAVTGINREIQKLAPVLNSEELKGEASATVSPTEATVAWTLRRHEKSVWLFAVGMQNLPVHASFKLNSAPAESGSVEVLGEARALPLRGGKFTDDFKPYQVHLYRLR